MHRALVVVMVCSSGCASVGQQCAVALLETTAQVCVDVLCDADGGELVDEAAPTAERRESPAPDWQPGPGTCEVTRGDDGSETVACADGTRAVFAASPQPSSLVVEHSTGGARLDAKSDVCDGGSVVREGLDLDGDGTLAPTEVSGHTVDCPDRDGVRAPTLVGHLAILGPDDVARVAGRRALTGGLTVRGPRLVQLALPQLQSLGATLRVQDAPALETLTLPNLASVGGDLVVSRAGRMVSLQAPALVRVGGAVIVVENPQLRQSDVEELVFRLSRHGYAGPVELAGNRP